MSHRGCGKVRVGNWEGFHPFPDCPRMILFYPGFSVRHTMNRFSRVGQERARQDQAVGGFNRFLLRDALFPKGSFE